MTTQPTNPKPMEGFANLLLVLSNAWDEGYKEGVLAGESGNYAYIPSSNPYRAQLEKLND